MGKKREVKTLHPLAMAKSLEAQNNSLLMLFSQINTLAQLHKQMKPDHISEQIMSLKAEADKVAGIFWPHDDE